MFQQHHLLLLLKLKIEQELNQVRADQLKRVVQHHHHLVHNLGRDQQQVQKQVQ
jgi:hypothetical protein